MPVTPAPAPAPAPALFPRRRELTDAERLLVEKDANLAPYMVGKMYPRVFEADRDDLVGVAYLALAEAARRSEPSRGHAFTSYACACIRGLHPGPAARRRPGERHGPQPARDRLGPRLPQPPRMR